MSKKKDDDRPRLNLAEERERLRADHSLPVELSDGTELIIDPPELWPDAAREVVRDPKKDDVDLGKALMGEENWERFVADGGTGALFSHLLMRRYELTTGESSASSSS